MMAPCTARVARAVSAGRHIRKALYVDPPCERSSCGEAERRRSGPDTNGRRSSTRLDPKVLRGRLRANGGAQVEDRGGSEGYGFSPQPKTPVFYVPSLDPLEQ